MEYLTSRENCPHLSFTALRLLVPPLRLVSAVIWQTIQHRIVADYGVLEEFVTKVTNIIPKLLTHRQTAQLTLGLRARMVLELCREELADIEIIQPHVDRIHTLLNTWFVATGATNMDQPKSSFLNLVQNLLKDQVKRKEFFQDVFPEEFGPTYDEDLANLMWLFLTRLDKFLPMLSLQEVSSMIDDDVSTVDCIGSVSDCEELKTVLKYKTPHSQLDHNDESLDGACIISALKLPSAEKNKKGQPLSQIKNLEHSCASAPQEESYEFITKQLLTARQVEDTRKNDMISKHPLKDCKVQLKRLDVSLSQQPLPKRKNRGLRMRQFFLQERRTRPVVQCKDESLSIKSPPSKRRSNGNISNNISNLSSVAYQEEELCSDEDPSVNASGSSTTNTTRPNSSNQGNFIAVSVEGKTSAHGVMHSASQVKAGAKRKKQTKQGQCSICGERVLAGMRSHMKIHFPNNDYTCPQCNTKFKLWTSLMLHLKRTCFEYGQQQVDPKTPWNEQNLFKCDECEQAFKYKPSLQAHKRTHNLLYCEVCRKVLRDSATLERHKKSHTPFQCTRCIQSFCLFKPLRRHYENTHKVNRPFQCEFCPKSFSRLRIFIAHEWKHTGYLPFQCALCGMRFKDDADLLSHQRVHTREKPYLCSECGKAFSQRSNLLRHFKFIHGEYRNEKNYACSQCEKSFKSKGALKKHQRSKHYKELFRHPCDHCGKMISASSIGRHKLIHTGEKPFKCTVPECDKYFRSTGEVRKHVMTHGTERPFKCDICGKGFTFQGILNTHMKTHSGEKPFACSDCGKRFPKLYSMRRHKKLVHAFAK